MLDKRHIFRRVNFILFVSYSLLSIFNDLNIIVTPLPVDLSVCIVLFLCFNSIFAEKKEGRKDGKFFDSSGCGAIPETSVSKELELRLIRSPPMLLVGS